MAEEKGDKDRPIDNSLALVLRVSSCIDSLFFSNRIILLLIQSFLAEILVIIAIFSF